METNVSAEEAYVGYNDERFYLDQELDNWVSDSGSTLSTVMWLNAGREIPAHFEVDWENGDCFDTDITNLTLVPTKCYYKGRTFTWDEKAGDYLDEQGVTVAQDIWVSNNGAIPAGKKVGFINGNIEDVRYANLHLVDA